MTLSEWKSNEKLCAWMRSVLANPAGKMLIEMLEDSHPRHFVLTDNINDTRELGKIYGYDMALNNLQDAINFIPSKAVAPEETYGAQKPQPSKK